MEAGIKLLGSAWQGVTGQVQAHLSVVRAVTEPIREQVALMERRAKIQSVDQAFGIKRDGLYGEVGAGLSADAAAAREKFIADQQKKVGQREGDGTRYTKKEFEGDVAQFDREAKGALDEYAIATGAATKESIMFADIQASLSKQAREGAISIREQTRATYDLANAMKDGKVSTEEAYDLKYKYGTPDEKKQVGVYRKRMADEERLEGKAKGDEVDESRPYDTVAKSADNARKASIDLATQGTTTGQVLAGAGSTAAEGMKPTMAAIDKTIGKFRELQAAFAGFVGTMTINVGLTSGGGRDSTGATNAGQSAKGKPF
jgi:hypothetical protein